MIDWFYAFIILGLFKLASLVWSDLKELKVDERHSTFMLGVVTLLYFLSGRLLEMLVVIFVSSFLLSKIKEREWLTGLGAGDLSILTWVLSGLWFFNYYYIVVFMTTYVLILLFLMKKLNKNSGLPATIPIVIGLIVVWATQSIGLII